MALVSVIIPCYNVEKYIDRCITSVKNQTLGFDNIEVICVDDCSTDNTLKKLLDWEKEYPDNFIIIPCEINGRQGQARNIGLEYSSAEYITFVDADDWLEKDYLSSLYAEILGNNLEIVTCQLNRDDSNEYVLWNDDSEADKHLYIAENEDDRKQLIMHQTFGGACCKLIKKSFLIDNGLRYPEGLCYEDLFWRETLHLYVNRGMVLDKALYHYYVNHSSTTLGQNESYHMDYFTIVVQLWNYFESSGFLEKFRQEIEYEYLIIAGLQIMKVLALRYTDSQYSSFRLLQNIIRQRIPSFAGNRYINSDYFTESQMLAIGALYMDMTQRQYDEFIAKLKLLGI